MTIQIEDKIFKSQDITQLYPAVIVKTGYKDETTQMSLEWLDIESKGKVEVDGYGIFIHLGKDEKYSFIYKNRVLLDEAIGKLAQQIKRD